jgi:hypothetical protein
MVSLLSLSAEIEHDLVCAQAPAAIHRRQSSPLPAVPTLPITLWSACAAHARLRGIASDTLGRGAWGREVQLRPVPPTGGAGYSGEEGGERRGGLGGRLDHETAVCRPLHRESGEEPLHLGRRGQRPRTGRGQGRRVAGLVPRGHERIDLAFGGGARPPAEGSSGSGEGASITWGGRRPRTRRKPRWSPCRDP